MQIDVSVPVLLASAVAVWLVGVGFGRLGSRRDRRARLRLDELEATLVEERERRVRYETEVVKHFGQTSQLFGDLTRQYTALYAHLAEGSRELCRERPASLAPSFAALPSGWTQGPPLELPGESPSAEVGGANGSDGADGEREAIPEAEAEADADAKKATATADGAPGD